MKQIRAEQHVENTVIREFEHIDKLEEHIQYDLIQAMAKDIINYGLIQIKETDVGEPCDATRYQVEMLICLQQNLKRYVLCWSTSKIIN